MKILVGARDTSALQQLERSLRNWGHETVGYTDGSELLADLGQQDTPRVVVMNWSLRGHGGPEVCWLARQQDSLRLVYILLLGRPDHPEDIVAGLQAGADDCQASPCDGQQLHARVCIGMRIAHLEERALEAERMQALEQTVGAIAHEFSQPLSTLVARTELMLRDPSLEGDPRRHTEVIKRSAHRITLTLRKLQNATRFATKPYVGNIRIVDIDAIGPPAEEGSGV